MRRWNGWGDDTIDAALNPGTRAMLVERLGASTPGEEASREAVLASVPPSRLPEHPLIDRSSASRVRVALGQSYHDWLKMKFGRFGAVPDGVAFPASSEAVREVLDLARAQGWIVIPYGGGTSVAGHLDCPDSPRPVLTVCLERLSHLIWFDQERQLASFGAGVVGPALEAQLRAEGYTLGHFPQSFEYSTLGGWVVTRSSGQQSLRYGRIEQLFAGGRFETPQGTLVLPTFPASAAGPDLREVVLGSEGRFGILTEATVRVMPLPEHERFHAFFLPDWPNAEAAVRTIAQAKLPLSMVRLSNPLETLTNLVLAGHPRAVGMMETYLGWRGAQRGRKCLLLVGVTGRRVLCDEALAAVRALGRPFGLVSAGTLLGSRWATNRFRGPYLRNSLWAAGYAVDTIETAGDWPRVTPLMQAMETAAREAFASFGEPVHAFTHLSHVYPQGSSVYSTFVWRIASGGFEANVERWRRYKAAVSEAIVREGGTISHQHGVGVDHAPYLVAEKGEAGMAALRAMSKHFDPDGIMNPGKLFTP